MNPYTFQTKIERHKGRVAGYMHRYTAKPLYLIGGAYLTVLDRAFSDRSNALDCALAFALGIGETGPGAWFGNQTDIRSHTKRLPFTKEIFVTVDVKPNSISVTVQDQDDVVFKRSITTEGFEGDINPKYDALAGYVAPQYHSFEALEELWQALGIDDSVNMQKGAR